MSKWRLLVSGWFSCEDCEKLRMLSSCGISSRMEERLLKVWRRDTGERNVLF